MLTEQEEQERTTLLNTLLNTLDTETFALIKRAVMLERTDAARVCPACESEHSTERMLADGTLPIVDHKNFTDQPTKAEPDIADHLMVFAQGPTNAQTPTRQATPKIDAGHEDGNDGPKEPLPNFRTCGVARAKPEHKAALEEPEWRTVLEKAINEYIASGMVRWGTNLFWICPKTPEVVISLWPLEQLRRVVLSGQGEALVPEAVAMACRDLYPEDGRWIARCHGEDLMRFVHAPSNGNCSVYRKSVLRAIDVVGGKLIKA